VNPLQLHTGEQNLRVSVKVYVLNKRGTPLMSTTPRTARILVRKNLAKVVKRLPFTIQLYYSTGETIQEVKLGIDTGYKNIGCSAITEKDELISGTLVLDGKTKERLEERKMYRKSRRSRHHWYRKPRWQNRVAKFNKVENWLPPSVERKYKSHFTLIKKIKDLLPISKCGITIEIGNFDIQKLINPEIEGKEYQQGDFYDYQNVRSYLMSREKGKCEHCKKDFKNSSSHIHHRKPRSSKGSNRLENLMLLHKKCHKIIHKNPKLLKKYEKSSTKKYKSSTFMNIIKNRFEKDIEDLKITFGYITFVKRNELKLEKSHVNDAFVIAGGTTQNRCKSFEIIQKHRNNRAIQLNRKGFKPSIRRSRSKIQPLDLLWVKGKKYICKGMHNKGKSVICVDESGKKKFDFSIKLVEKIFNFGGFVWNYYKEKKAGSSNSSPL
jgi:5-methylcytosine-specific restriction endonuclease McrA